MKFIVKEKYWFRGQGPEKSRLLRKDGTKCCLGFVGEQCGFSKKDLRYNRVPVETVNSFSNQHKRHMWPKWIIDIYHNSQDCNLLISINDDKSISDFQRKKQIRAVFKKHGDTIIFSKKD